MTPEIVRTLIETEMDELKIEDTRKYYGDDSHPEVIRRMEDQENLRMLLDLTKKEEREQSDAVVQFLQNKGGMNPLIMLVFENAQLLAKNKPFQSEVRMIVHIAAMYFQKFFPPK